MPVRPTVVLDFNAGALVRGPGGTALEWLGRAVDYQPGPGGNPIGHVTVRAAGPCGEGRYAVWLYGNWFNSGTVRLADPVDACADRVAVLAGTSTPCIVMRLGCPVWIGPGPISIAEASASFTEPFGYWRWDPNNTEWSTKQIWRWGTRGGLLIQYGYLRLTWIDDQPVNIDPCDWTKGSRPDVPDSPQAVGDWLRSSPGLIVLRQTELMIDGRTALRFDLRLKDGCDPGPNGPPHFVGMGGPIYAIPTARDTIIVSSSWDGSAGQAWAEAFIRSLTFRSGR